MTVFLVTLSRPSATHGCCYSYTNSCLSHLFPTSASHLRLSSMNMAHDGDLRHLMESFWCLPLLPRGHGAAQSNRSGLEYEAVMASIGTPPLFGVSACSNKIHFDTLSSEALVGQGALDNKCSLRLKCSLWFLSRAAALPKSGTLDGLCTESEREFARRLSFGAHAVVETWTGSNLKRPKRQYKPMHLGTQISPSRRGSSLGTVRRREKSCTWYLGEPKEPGICPRATIHVAVS